MEGSQHECVESESQGVQFFAALIHRKEWKVSTERWEETDKDRDREEIHRFFPYNVIKWNRTSEYFPSFLFGGRLKHFSLKILCFILNFIYMYPLL